MKRLTHSTACLERPMPIMALVAALIRIWDRRRRLHAALPGYRMWVELKESSTTGCVYRGKARK